MKKKEVVQSDLLFLVLLLSEGNEQVERERISRVEVVGDEE